MAVEYYIHNPEEQLEEAYKTQVGAFGAAIAAPVETYVAKKLKDKELSEKLLENIDELLSQADAYNADLIKERVTALSTYTEEHFQNGGSADNAEFKTFVKKSTREIKDIGMRSKQTSALISDKMKVLRPQIQSGLISSDVYETLIALNTDVDILTGTKDLNEEIDKIIKGSLDTKAPSLSIFEANKGNQIESNNIISDADATDRDSTKDYTFKRTNTGHSSYMDMATGEVREDLPQYLAEVMKNRVNGNYVPFKIRQQNGIGTYNTNQIILDRSIEEYNRIRFHGDYSNMYNLPDTDDPFLQAGYILARDSYFDRDKQIIENERVQITEATRTDQEYLESIKEGAKHTFLGETSDYTIGESEKVRSSLDLLLPVYYNALTNKANPNIELNPNEVRDLDAIQALLSSGKGIDTKTYEGHDLVYELLLGGLNHVILPEGDAGESQYGAQAEFRRNVSEQKIKELALFVEESGGEVFYEAFPEFAVKENWSGLYTSQHTRTTEEDMMVLKWGYDNQHLNGQQIIELVPDYASDGYSPTDEYIWFKPTNQDADKLYNITKTSPDVMSSILSTYGDKNTLINLAERIYNRDRKDKPDWEWPE